MMAYFLGGVGAGIIIVLVYLWWSVGRHKRIRSLTKFIVFSFAVLLSYYAAEFVVSTITGVSHDTLTTCITSVFGGEVVTCGLIKIFKLKEEKNE